MAPTIYHNAQAILQLLQNFNWTHFTIVTTSDDSYYEFNAAIDQLMKEHEEKKKITDKFSYVTFVLASSPCKIVYVHCCKKAKIKNKTKNRSEERIYIVKRPLIAC